MEYSIITYLWLENNVFLAKALSKRFGAPEGNGSFENYADMLKAYPHVTIEDFVKLFRDTGISEKLLNVSDGVTSYEQMCLEVYTGTPYFLVNLVLSKLTNRDCTDEWFHPDGNPKAIVHLVDIGCRGRYAQVFIKNLGIDESSIHLIQCDGQSFIIIVSFVGDLSPYEAKCQNPGENSPMCDPFDLLQGPCGKEKPNSERPSGRPDGGDLL